MEAPAQSYLIQEVHNMVAEDYVDSPVWKADFGRYKDPFLLEDQYPPAAAPILDVKP